MICDRDGPEHTKVGRGRHSRFDGAPEPPSGIEFEVRCLSAAAA